MNDISNIGGPDRTGQGGGSGNYYVPMRTRQQIKTETQKLKVGEIVLGTIIEILDKDVARVKLPMGVFSAVLHNRLKSGDTLFLYVAEIEPQLVLRVHSVSTTVAGNLRGSPEIIRILDLPEKPIVNDIINFLLPKKSTILRSEVLNFLNYLEQLEFNENIHSKTAYFQSIFTFLILLNKDISLVKRFCDVFLPLEELFKFLLPSINKFELFKLYPLKTETIELADNQKIIELLTKFKEFITFASANSQPVALLYFAKTSIENIIFRIELFVDAPSFGLKPNYLPIIESFNLNFEQQLLPFLMDNLPFQKILSNKNNLIESLEKQLLKNNCVISHFSIYSDKNGNVTLKDGILRALPRNFTVVI